MTIIDFILLFILAFATASGFFFGVIRVVGGIASIIASIIVAGLFFEDVMPSLQPYLLDSSDLASVVAFLLLYWVTSSFLSFIIMIVNKIFNLPILKTVNRVLGGAVALVGTIVVLSVFFFLFDKYAWVESLQDFIRESTIAVYLTDIGYYVSFVIPGL